MHRSEEALGRAILALTSFINDPRQDWRMMAEASLDLDPAFLPLLVRLGAQGPAGIVELSGQLGRDHSTISRQVAKLETAGLVLREPSPTDGRARTARITPRGMVAVAAITAARGRLLDRALDGWTKAERKNLTTLLGRFVEALGAARVTPERRQELR